MEGKKCFLVQGDYGGGNQKKTSGTLHLFNVTLEDDGIYFCVTHNPLLNISKKSNPAKLTVQGEYIFGYFKSSYLAARLICNEDNKAPLKCVCVSICLAGVPRSLQIMQDPDNITVAMGTEVSMHCAVRGFPVPMVHWFKDDGILTNCSASFSLQNNGQLLTFRSDPGRDKRNINSLLFFIVFLLN